MTQSLPPSYLDAFFGPAAPRYSGNDLPKRGVVEYVGGGVVVTDDPVNQRTQVAIGGVTLGGDVNGYAQVTAANGIVVTTAKGKDTDFWFAATTPNATTAAFFSYALLSTSVARIISVEGIITLFNGGSGYAKYKLDGLYTMSSGNVLTKRSVTPSDVATGPESSSSTDVILTLTGNTIVVQGAGFSASNSWTGRIFIHEASF